MGFMEKWFVTGAPSLAQANKGRKGMRKCMLLGFTYSIVAFDYSVGEFRRAFFAQKTRAIRLDVHICTP